MEDAESGWDGWGAPDGLGDATPMAVDEAAESDAFAAPEIDETTLALAPVEEAPAPTPTPAPPFGVPGPGPYPQPPPPAPNGTSPSALMVQAGPYYPQQGAPPPPPPGYHPAAMQVGVMPQETSHVLGLSALAVAVGALIGWRYGGAYGSIAGGLLGGSTVNAYRALYYYKEGTPEGDKEAAVSATYAALTTAVGGYLIATKAQAPAPAGALTPNPDDDDPYVEPAGPCATRPVGPSILPPESAFEDEPSESEE